MGSQQDEGLLLQPVLIPSDASEKKEQDEGSGGSGKKDAQQAIIFVMVTPRLQINHTDGRLWKPV